MSHIRKLQARIEKMFAAPTLAEVMAHQMQEATRERQQAQYIILTHRFQDHMAAAKMAALESWNHRGDA